MTMNWDYIAGFFDGEGNIVQLNLGYGSYRVSFAQSNKGILVMIADFLEEYGIHTWITYKQPTALTRSPSYHLAFSKSTSVRFFLEMIKDRVVVKREQVLETLENLTYRTTYPVLEPELQDIIAMHNDGLSQREIGNLLDRSQGVISRNLQRRAVL